MGIVAPCKDLVSDRSLATKQVSETGRVYQDMLQPQDFVLPSDQLFAKILKVASLRGNRFIVDDRSRGVQSTYGQILYGTVTLRQSLQNQLDASLLKNKGNFFVALAAPTGYEFIIGVLAVLALGGVVVPIPTGALPAEIACILQDCQACCLLVGPEQVELASQIHALHQIPTLAIEGPAEDTVSIASYSLDSALAVSEDCPSILFFTSGTTGLPKGVLHARRTINKYARTETIEADDEICLIPRGAFWSLYFSKVFQMLLLGVRIEIQNFGRNYNLIWDKFRERTGTKIVLSPTFWHAMMKYYETHITKLPGSTVREYTEGFRYLRDVSVTGAMPSPQVKQFWQELRDGRPLKVQYGTTETQEISAFGESSGSFEADLGTPFPGVVIKLSEGDHGEVLVKTPSMFLGYLNDMDASAKRFDSKGFFKTGDLATRVDGRFVFQGRVNMDMFKFYTYKVPRMRVESFLLALPYVAEGYIMPVEDSQCDTRVAALVRLQDSHDTLDLSALRNDLGGDLPAYQLPTMLRLLDKHETVPRTWSDKTAMKKAVDLFFPADGEHVVWGSGIEVMDVSQFMKSETAKMWDLSGMR